MPTTVLIAHYPLEFIYALWAVCYGLVPLTLMMSLGGYLKRRKLSLLVSAGVAGLQLLWGVVSWVIPAWGWGARTAIVMICVGCVNALVCLLMIWRMGNRNQTTDGAVTKA